MQDAEFLVQALGALSLTLWLTTRAFRLGPVADRRILATAYLALAGAFAVAIVGTVRYFCG
jgi:hypothetical protein